MVAFGLNWLQKTLEEKVVDWLKKKIFLLVNIKLHFNQMDAWGLPAQQHVLFFLVLDIIWLSKYVPGVLFVCLFIDFACELVWNVLVNQKGFLYITYV